MSPHQSTARLLRIRGGERDGRGFLFAIDSNAAPTVRFRSSRALSPSVATRVRKRARPGLSTPCPLLPIAHAGVRVGSTKGQALEKAGKAAASGKADLVRLIIHIRASGQRKTLQARRPAVHLRRWCCRSR
jgi:hypothetical protein